MKYKKYFWIELSVVLAILLLGAYVRFTHLTSLPPGLYPDEAMNTTDGLRTAEAGGWQLFYENNNGREGLYINILGYLLHWFGPSLWIVRFLPALIGTLTLPAVYWLGRRASGRFGGVMALGLIAFSYWHLNFSRVGFRALLMVFMLAWAFAFLVEGFWRIVYDKKPRKSVPDWLFFAVGGLFLGLSLHTYIAVRIAPAAVAVLWLLALIFFWELRKTILKYLVITGLFGLITAAPMLYDFASHPEHFSSRTSNVSVLNSPHMIQDLGKSVFLTLASFIAYGDQNWRHNYPFLPLVLPIWGLILFIGVIWGIAKLFKELSKRLFKKGIKDKNKKWEMVVWIFLIAWWGFLLVPSMMTNEGLPHALRSIGAIPPTFLLVGMIINKWSKSIKLKAIFSGLVVLSAIFSVYAYFFMWGRNPVTYGAFEHRLSGIGIYLRDEIPQEPKTNFYLVAKEDSQHTDANLPVSVEPIRFYTWQYRNRLDFVLPENFSAEKIKLPAKIFFVDDNSSIINDLKSQYPNAQLNQVKVGGGIDNRNSNPIIFAPVGEESFLTPPISVDSQFSFLDIR